MALGRRRALVIGAAAAAAAAAGGLAWRLLDDDGGVTALRSAEFTDLEGRARRLAEWDGKVVLCNFWATWCRPCREEVPMLVRLSNELGSKRVAIVGIAVDFAAKVREFAKEYKVTYPILLAGPDGIDLMRATGNRVGGLPYTVLLDRHGAIAHRKLGILKETEVRAWLTELIGA